MSINKLAIADAPIDVRSGNVAQVKRLLRFEGVNYRTLPTAESEFRKSHPELQKIAREVLMGSMAVESLVAVIGARGDFRRTKKTLNEVDGLIIPNVGPPLSRGSQRETRVSLGAVVQAQLAHKSGLPVFVAGPLPDSLEDIEEFDMRIATELKQAEPYALTGDFGLIQNYEGVK